MAEELICNEDYEIDNILPVVPGGQTPIPKANFGDPSKISFIETFSEVKVGDITTQKKVLTGLQWTVFSGSCQLTGHTHAAGGGSIIVTSITKYNDFQCLRKTDTGICNCVFTNSSTGATVSASCTFKFSDSGNPQIKAN